MGRRDSRLYRNTAFSSYRHPRRGRRVPQLMGDVITAHELGHNWGAEDELNTSECASPGNPFIINENASNGSGSNNLVFSPCSRRLIARVLGAKSDKCFVNYTGRLRQRRVEKKAGEECDVGFTEETDSDACCDTRTCTLKRSGARDSLLIGSIADSSSIHSRRDGHNLIQNELLIVL